MDALLRIIVASMVILATNVAYSQSLQRNGLARYVEYNSPVFVAALETSTSAVDAESLLAGEQPFRMEIAIEAKSLSKRRFRRLWIENVSINHDIGTLRKFNNDLGGFVSLVTTKLITGDRFSITYTENGRTEVSLNDVVLGKYTTKGFGPLLLSSWIGKVPLSSPFKQAILANDAVDPQLAVVFDGLVPSASRKAGTKALFAENEKSEAAPVAAGTNKVASADKPKQEKPKAAKTVEQAKSTTNNTKVVAKSDAKDKSGTKDKKAPQSLVAATTAAASSAAKKVVKAEAKKVEEIAKAPKVAAVKVKPDVKPEVKPEPKVSKAPEVKVEKPVVSAPVVKNDVVEKKTPLKETQAPTAVAKTEAKVAAEKPDSDDDLPLFDEGALELRQVYYQDLIRAVRKYKTIPFQAFQRRWEGDVRLRVTINRSGKLLGTEVVESSKHKLFEKQAISAVKKASPFSPMPDGLRGEEFTFSVPLSYRMAY